jgi:hypothetical protein
VGARLASHARDRPVEASSMPGTAEIDVFEAVPMLCTAEIDVFEAVPMLCTAEIDVFEAPAFAWRE